MRKTDFSVYTRQTEYQAEFVFISTRAEIEFCADSNAFLFTHLEK